NDSSHQQLLQCVAGVTTEGDGAGLSVLGAPRDTCKSVVNGSGDLVHVPADQPPLDTRRIDLDAENHAPRELRGESLSTSHASKSGRRYEPPQQRLLSVAKMLPPT